MLETWRWVLLVLSICILGWSPGSINAATDPADVSALKTLYSSLNSPSQLTQWSASGDDPCGQSWKGVKCSGSRVTEIDVSNLQLSGSLWSSLQSLTALTNLDMSHNNLAGSIPYSLPPNMTRLNLAANNFNQGIPYSISLITSLEYLNISHNQLQNQVDDIFGKLSSLSTLDLSFNSLSGNLPESLSSLSSMTTMNLQNNQLTGPINVLANLPLENLNIQNNQFTGWIPEQLKNINLEKDGNTWNSGPAPPPPPGTPPASKNNGNHKSGSNGSSSKGGAGEGGKKSGIGGGGVAGIVISLLVVTGVVAFFVIKRRSRRSSSDVEKFDSQPFAPLASEVKEMKSVQTPATLDMKTFDTPATINLRPPPVDRHKSFDEEDFSKKPIVVKKTSTAPLNVTSYSIADLQIATGSFNVENLLGEGSFGRVYRAQFDDGKVLAVKKIDSSVLPSELSEDFTEIVSNISLLHHPNVTELVGYCSEHGQHLLVYEFHKSGSLHDFLHLSDDYNKPLTWNSRVKIALGTARALEYLHEVCSPSIIHKNIKSANILLDVELNPHLSDTGLASFIPNADQALEHNVGSGYSAPEVAMSGQYTLKSDVYGFGVVMLELISGRKPFDSSKPRSEQSLVRWATPQLHDIDALSKMVDPALKGLYPVKSLSRFADVIALCVQPEPEFRPPMSVDIPLMALTATATIQVRKDILRSLSMSKETKVVLTSFFRPNLRFTVQHSRTSASSYENDFHELIDTYTGKRRMGEKKQIVMSQELNNVMDSANGSISDEDNISQDDLDNFEDGYSDKDEVDSSQENGSSASKGRELSVEYLEDDIDIFQSVNDWDVSCGEFCGQSLCEDWNTRKETISDIIDLPNKPEERLKLLQEPLEKGSTIIYVPTRKGTLSIANYLCRCGVKAAAYNAALPKSHLRQVHKMFHENTLEVVVATIAFGMGIDKLNVRRIIHYGWPQSLEAYYQEAGRAGRDGKLADCILFANLTRVPSLLPSRRSEEQTKQAYKMLSDCFRYGMNSSCCRAKKLVEYFGEDFSSEKCLLCDVCVAGPPELKNLRKEADLIMQVISAHHASQYRIGSYDDATSSDIRLRRESYMGKLNLRMIISKIREQSQEFMATELLWWQGLVRIMESKGYIKEGDNKTHVQLKFPELTELGLEFLETKGEQTFYVHPEADMLLSANRPKSFSTFSEWGRGWADPEIRRQRLENMQCNRKPFNAGGKRGRRKSRKQRHSPNLRTARGRIEAKLSKKGARPRSLKH